MEAADQEYLGGLPASLISSSNLAVARPIFWLSLALFALTAAVIFIRFIVQLWRSASTGEEAPAR